MVWLFLANTFETDDRFSKISKISKILGEKARICAAGGSVDFGRVNGNLALSRAIGDFGYKRRADLQPELQIVPAFPDLVIHEVSDDDEFLVIACDGVVPREIRPTYGC